MTVENGKIDGTDNLAGAKSNTQDDKLQTSEFKEDQKCFSENSRGIYSEIE